ncbi:MAG: hypothetical protein KDA05_09580 [Phycisphaerales bacterium]|nr:hypothetical protein [Phycisphaerales bacterium]
MDERQQQIRAGAGLEESRLNTEFIDFIQKWGGPFLLLCAAIMGAWAASNWWNKQQAQRLDEAFGQYEAQLAGGNPSPEALKAVAAEYEGVASVALLARLDAAEVYMGSVRSGLKAGATLGPDGTAAAEDLLTDDDRTRLLSQAEGLYRQCFDQASAARGRSLLAIRAAYGLAAVAECRAEFDAARGHYERIAELADTASLSNHAAFARSRLADLGDIQTMPRLWAAAELAQKPIPEVPEGTGLEGLMPFDPGAIPTAPETLGPVAPGMDPGLDPGALPALDPPAAPGAPEPAGTEPGTTEPGTTEPGATPPAGTDPGSSEPGAADPETPPSDPPADPPAAPPSNPGSRS